MKILTFGAHPDDIEIGIFGTLAKHYLNGDEIILCDLTQGEMGSNGSVEERNAEAQKAAKLINANRINLKLPDRGLRLIDEHIYKIVETIRREKPDYILYPYHTDYHPDHEMASRLIKEAIHSSGLKHYHTDNLEKHRPLQSAQYFINDLGDFNLLVDISEVMPIKIEALQAHQSQFVQDANSVVTYLNSGFIEKVKIRNAYLGSVEANCSYAEALKLDKKPVVDLLMGSLK